MKGKFWVQLEENKTIKKSVDLTIFLWDNITTLLDYGFFFPLWNLNIHSLGKHLGNIA